MPENAFLFWETVYVPRIIAALVGDPVSTVQLFNVTQAAIDSTDPSSIITTALSLLIYSIFNDNDQKATAGGVAYDNRSTTYIGSVNDAALNAEVERVKSDGRARAYSLRFYEPSGNLHGPLVTLHTTIDEVIPFQHEVSYSNLVAQKGKSALFSILPVPRYGHCNFTAQEVIQAFQLMVPQAEAQLIK